MNWGHKITVLYLAFVAMILIMVFMTMNEKVELVSADYYDQEIKFQGKIDAINNTHKLSGPLEFQAKNKIIQIFYPKELIGKGIQGEIKLYRPSDASLDYKTTINVNEKGEQQISSGKFKKGLYKMQMKWVQDKQNYYFEEQVFMN